MRLFQFLENILVAKQAARQKDDLVKILTILKTTGYGGWLVFDLILFCNNFKIYISSDQKGIVKSKLLTKYRVIPHVYHADHADLRKFYPKL